MNQTNDQNQPRPDEEVKVKVRDLRGQDRPDKPTEAAPEAEVEPNGSEDSAAEVAELKDQLLRLHAEQDNFRKRTAREQASFRKYANEGLIKDLLPQIDNLERALEHGRESTPDDPLLQGLEMTLKGLLDALEKHGVAVVESVGQQFDPNLHEAMMQQDDPEAEQNTVLAEHQRGYLLHDRLLRPAMVVVSK